MRLCCGVMRAILHCFFFFSSRRRHTRFDCDWSSDVCSSDLARRHELVLELPDELITVEGDKTRLTQMIGNVLHNAAKFTNVGGRIVLKVTREGASAVISVKDTGIGIAKEAMPQIFELFAQVHAKSECSQGGLGIGLALVRRLAEMHGG